MKYYLKLLSIPLSLLFVFVSLFLIWKIFDLPETEILLFYIDAWFNKYGLSILFISALIEGMLLFGGYFPGVFVIFVSVVLANSVPEAALRVFVGTTGLLIAHIANYFLGKYGWYKLLARYGLAEPIKESQEKITKYGPIAIFTSYWMPSIGALTDTAAGILQMSFRRFIIYSLVSLIFWDTLVGVVVYLLGKDALIAVSSGGATELFIQLAIVAVWILILLFFDFKKRHTLSKS